MITSRTAITAVSVAVLIAGCGSNLTPAAAPHVSTPATTNGPATTVRPTTTAGTTGDRGWIDGEPSWVAEYSDGSGDAAKAMSAGAAPGTAAAAATGVAGPPIVGPDPGPPQPLEQAGLRAGSVDDNVDFADFLTYLARIHDLGIMTRPFDPSGRVVVNVVGRSGLPVAGAQVTVTAGGTQVASLRTTANGTARFLPALYGAGGDATFTFTSGDASVDGAPGSSVTLQPAIAGGRSGPVALDVLFLLDATGSMGDEIDRLKSTIDTVAAQVKGFDSQPDVRFAMTLYRDEGDTFLTKTFDFTADIDVFHAALAQVIADGGGDYPEAVEEGLASALSEPTWRDPSSTLQLVFLVGDAPPRLDRQVPVEYPAAVIDAVARGIKVFPIASSESDDQAEAVFREIAAATGARFVFLAYGAQGAATGAATDISTTDYEELPLDALVVRLVAEELAALSGTPVQLPPVSVPPVTNPEGQ